MSESYTLDTLQVLPGALASGDILLGRRAGIDYQVPASTLGGSADFTYVVNTTGYQAISGLKLFNNGIYSASASTFRQYALFRDQGIFVGYSYSTAANITDTSVFRYAEEIFDRMESINFHDRILFANIDGYTQTEAVNWGDGSLASTDNGVRSVNWTSRNLYDSDGSTALNWWEKILSTGWLAPNPTIASGLATKSYVDGTIGSATGQLYPISNPSGYITGTVIPSSVVRTTGAQNISGAKRFYNSNGNPTLYSDTCELRDAVSGTISLLWSSRSLIDQFSFISVDWGNRIMNAQDGAFSLDWTNRLLSNNWLSPSPTLSSGIVNKSYADTISGSLQTGINNLSLVYYPYSANPSGYLQSGTAASTYATIANLSATGAANAANIATNTAIISSLTSATGGYYPSSNPSGYLQSGIATGLYATLANLAATGAAAYPRTNPSGYLQSGVATGLYATIANLAATGAAAYPRTNPSGYMTQGKAVAHVLNYSLY